MNLKAFLILLNLVSIVQSADLFSLNLKRSRTINRIRLREKYDIETLSRIKKEIVLGGSCSRGRRWYNGTCITLEEYQRLVDSEYEDYDEITVEDTQTQSVQKEHISDAVATKNDNVINIVSSPQERELSVKPLHNTEKKLESDVIKNPKNFVDKTLIAETKTNIPDTVATKINTVQNNLVDSQESGASVKELHATEKIPESNSIENRTTQTKNVMGVVYFCIALGIACLVVSIVFQFKLLYDFCLRKNDSGFIPCSTDDIQIAISSQHNLYPR